MPVYHAASEEELNAQAGKYKPLPEENYILQVDSIEVQKDQPDRFRKGKDGQMLVRDTLLVKVNILAFKDDPEAELVDEEGEPTEDRYVKVFIDPSRQGLKPKPATARKFFAAVLGQPLEDDIVIEEWGDLTGKKFVGHLTIVKRDDGRRFNKVTEFWPFRKRPAVKRKSDAEVKAEAADSLVEAAAKVFEGDVVETVVSGDKPY